MARPDGTVRVPVFNTAEVRWAGDGFTNHHLRAALESIRKSLLQSDYTYQVVPAEGGFETISLHTHARGLPHITVRFFDHNGRECQLPPNTAEGLLLDSELYSAVTLVVSKDRGAFKHDEAQKARVFVQCSTHGMPYAQSLRDALLFHLMERPRDIQLNK